MNVLIPGLFMGSVLLVGALWLLQIVRVRRSDAENEVIASRLARALGGQARLLRLSISAAGGE
jgi:hypothetical protein